MKTPKVKKRAVSMRSRAARRGASPPPDVAVKASVKTTDYQPWLHSAQNAGISKKTKQKQVSRQQRLRQQRGLEKADANLDKLEKKLADSKSRARKVDARRVDWEELNEKLAEETTKLDATKAAEQARKKAVKEQHAAEKELDHKVDGLVETLEDVELPTLGSSATGGQSDMFGTASASLATPSEAALHPSTAAPVPAEEIDLIT